jgi:hypothetical protein
MRRRARQRARHPRRRYRVERDGLPCGHRRTCRRGPSAPGQRRSGRRAGVRGHTAPGPPCAWAGRNSTARLDRHQWLVPVADAHPRGASP